MPAVASQRVTYEEYLRLEASTDERHEFFDGVVLAMACGTMAHAKVKINLTLAVGAALRGHPCHPRATSGGPRVEFDQTGGLRHRPVWSTQAGPR